MNTMTEDTLVQQTTGFGVREQLFLYCPKLFLTLIIYF